MVWKRYKRTNCCDACCLHCMQTLTSVVRILTSVLRIATTPLVPTTAAATSAIVSTWTGLDVMTSTNVPR